MRRRSALAIGAVLLLSITAVAQERKSEISLQGMGFFTSSSSGNGTDYSATESGGFLGTYRHHLNRWASIEAAYGYTLNTQKYGLGSQPFRIQSGIQQFTGSLVASLPSHAHSRVNPYVLVGGGGLLFDPTGNQVNSFAGAQTQVKAAFVYGLGLNYGIHKGIALRAEYRGLVYANPDFGFSELSTNSVTQTSEPSLGLSFRF